MPEPPPPPRFLDRVRAAVRARHFSRRTEKVYVAWVRRFILFHDKRHPADMGGPEVSKFLSALAMEQNVAASTQNQALSALLFLYRAVLGHRDVSTTMIYTHVLNRGRPGSKAPRIAWACDPLRPPLAVLAVLHRSA